MVTTTVFWLLLLVSLIASEGSGRLPTTTCRFSNSGQQLGHAASHRVVLLDPDNDGSLDVVVANRAEPSTYWKNQGNGRFVLEQELKKTDGGELNDYVWAVESLDANADGHADIVLLGDASGSTSASRIWLWRPSEKRFVPVGSRLPTEANFARFAAVGDFNEDGYSDLVVGGLSRTAVLLMDPSTITMTTSFSDDTLKNVYGLDVGDINEDGHLDIIVVRTDGPNEILLGAGNGTFQIRPDALPGSSMEWSRGVSLGDVNGDGHLDAVVANRAIGRLKDNTVWLGDGKGGFQDSGQRLEPNSDSYAVVLSDLDGDGDLDAVLANWASNSVWINSGQGKFIVKTLPHTSSLGTFGVAVGDLTESGYPDLFFADNNGGGEGAPNIVWINECRHGPPPTTTTTTTTGGQEPSPPGETPGSTVMVHFEGTTPSARLIPVDHCGKRHETKSLKIRFDSIVELDAHGNKVKTVDFGTSSYTYTRPGNAEHQGEEAFRFATDAHGGTITFDVSLFRDEAEVNLEDIVGNISFTVHPDTFKWSIRLDSWPFWGDQVEQHTLELAVTLESGDGLILPQQQQGALSIQESEHLVLYLLRTDHTTIKIRVLDVARVDGKAAPVAHALDTDKEKGDVRGIKFVFPKFDQQIAFDPDISVLLEEGDSAGDDECGRDSTNTALMIALVSVLVPVCILGALAILAMAFVIPKILNCRSRRLHRKRIINGAINYDMGDELELMKPGSDHSFKMVQVTDLQGDDEAAEKPATDGTTPPPSPVIEEYSTSSSSESLPADTRFVHDDETDHVFPVPGGGDGFTKQRKKHD